MNRKFNALCFIGCLMMVLNGCNTTVESKEDSGNSIEINDIEQEKELKQEKENDVKENVEEVNGIENDKEQEEEEMTIQSKDKDARVLSFFDESSGLLPVSVDTKGEYFVNLAMYPQLKDSVEHYQEEYEKGLQDQENNAKVSASHMTDIQRADTYAYSVLVRSFAGEGAEKRYLEYTCFNYNVQNGELLKLDEIVKDKDMLILALAEQLEGSCSEDYLSIEASALAAALCEEDNRRWNIGYQGLIFYADSALTGNDEAECITAMVTFAENQGLFYEECMQVPERYAVTGDALSTFVYDLNEDGQAEEINISCETAANHEIEKIILKINDLEKVIDINMEDEKISSDGLCCNILHIGKEKNLIYIHAPYFLDDLYYGVVLEVVDSEIKILNNEAGIDIEGHPLIDPQNIACKDEDILLGSVGYFYILKCWEFDENGQLNMKAGTMYYLSSDFQIETAIELEADKVEENGNIIDPQILLPAGTILVPVRTDEKTYVDFTDRDGNVYRIAFEVKADPDYGRVGIVQEMAAAKCMRAVVNRPG